MNCSPVSECKFFSTYQGNIFVAEGPNAQCTLSGPRGGACTYHQFLQRSLTPTFTKTVWLAGPCGAYAEPVVSCDMYHMVGSCPSFTGTKGCAFVDDQVGHCGGLASRANARCILLPPETTAVQLHPGFDLHELRSRMHVQWQPDFLWHGCVPLRLAVLSSFCCAMHWFIDLAFMHRRDEMPCPSW
jgi:hypothetical protein